MAQKGDAEVQRYVIKGTGMTKRDLKEAYREIDRYSNDNLLLSYSDWAKEAVHYNDISEKQIAEKLSHANDGYTLSMLANAFATFGKGGIDTDNFFKFYVSMYVMRLTNPEMDMDLSRTFNLISSNLNDLSNNLPFGVRTIGRLALNSAKNGFESVADDRFDSALNRGLANHDIDSIRMSPRQLAAIKVNFMEQCYCDMRKAGNSLDDINKCEACYNQAVAHINQIARNNGFDMSVVAEEERYIVGLKMRNNPRYGLIFKETTGPYAAKPMTNGSKWSGRFETGDGHEYTVGGHVEMGAFTIRRPAQSSYVGTNEKGKDAIEDKVGRYAAQFATMFDFVENGPYKFSKDQKTDIEFNINNQLSAYRKSVKAMLVDDGIVSNAHEADKWWKKHFIEPMNKTRENNKSSDYKKADFTMSQSGEYSEKELTIYGGFSSEIDRTLNKTIFNKVGLMFDKPTEKYLRQADYNIRENECRRKAGFKMRKFIDSSDLKDNFPAMAAIKDEVAARSNQNKTAGNNAKDERKSWEILKDMRINYVRTMDASEITALLMHSATDLEQGWENRASYDRTYLDGKSLDGSVKDSQKIDANSKTKNVPKLNQSGGIDRTGMYNGTDPKLTPDQLDPNCSLV